jgi:hypothetical protein
MFATRCYRLNLGVFFAPRIMTDAFSISRSVQDNPMDSNVDAGRRDSEPWKQEG